MNNYIISQQIKEQLKKGKYEPHEVVVALIAMAKEGHIKEKDIKPILLNILPKGEALKALTKANDIIDKTLIDNIITEVRKETL